MRLAFVYSRAMTVELLRMPSFVVPTVAYPALVFLVLGLPNVHGEPDVLLASYAAFAILGVGFFQFGVGLAIERTTPWQSFMRTLPAPPWPRIAGRAAAAALFGAATTVVVVIVVLATTSAGLSALGWARLAAALLLGSIPFVVLGVAMAYWFSPRGALPIANALYLLLSYTGGLWTGPDRLPDVVRSVSPYTPTRQWGEVLWPAVSDQPWRPRSWLLLAAWGAAFVALAAWGYLRDEGQRFR